jgi:hypothetical protein
MLLLAGSLTVEKVRSAPVRRLDGRDLGPGPALVPGAATDVAEKTSLRSEASELPGPGLDERSSGV